MFGSFCFRERFGALFLCLLCERMFDFKVKMWYNYIKEIRFRKQKLNYQGAEKNGESFKVISERDEQIFKTIRRAQS